MREGDKTVAALGREPQTWRHEWESLKKARFQARLGRMRRSADRRYGP